MHTNLCAYMYLYVRECKAGGKPWVLALKCHITCPVFDRGLSLGMEPC